MKNLILALTVILSATNAFAGGYITPNTQVSGDAANSISDGSTIPAVVDDGLSYCCSFHPNGSGVAIVEASTTVALIALNNNNINITAIDRTLTTPIMPGAALNHLGNRLCFISSRTGVARFTIVDISVGSQAVTTVCEETTLYGDFNTNANPYNFLEITNTTNSAITGKIYATSSSGTAVIDGSTFSIPANRRVDTSIHDAAGANVYGSIKIVHDGPLGALRANVSYYSGPVSALELKATVPATTRDRH